MEVDMKKVSLFSQVAVISSGIFLFLAVLLGVSHAADIAYKFEVMDIPLRIMFLGERRDDIVRLTDIDNKGRMAGNDFAGDGFFVGVRHKAHEIRCPSDQTDNDSTTASAINNLGQVVGSCTDGGFIRDRNRNITILNFPGADGTVALGINDLGHVVGQYWGNLFGQGLQRFHGFVWKNGEYTTIDAPFPEAMFTTLSGINNAGQIIGTYLHHRPGSPDINEYDSEVAFVYDNGSFTELDFPGAQIPFCCGAQTFPMDINNLGQIVGSTYSDEGKLQFFLFDDGTYFRITGLPENVVDAAGSWGLNDKSHIAGTYIQRVPCDTCGFEGEPGFKSILHSFVAKPTKASKKQLVN
jgi:uncharacterized membrane protein